jgi:hypothetical protein
MKNDGRTVHDSASHTDNSAQIARPFPTSFSIGGYVAGFSTMFSELSTL